MNFHQEQALKRQKIAKFSQLFNELKNLEINQEDLIKIEDLKKDLQKNLKNNFNNEIIDINGTIYNNDEIIDEIKTLEAEKRGLLNNEVYQLLSQGDPQLALYKLDEAYLLAFKEEKDDKTVYSTYINGVYYTDLQLTNGLALNVDNKDASLEEQLISNQIIIDNSLSDNEIEFKVKHIPKNGYRGMSAYDIHLKVIIPYNESFVKNNYIQDSKLPRYFVDIPKSYIKEKREKLEALNELLSESDSYLNLMLERLEENIKNIKNSNNDINILLEHIRELSLNSLSFNEEIIINDNNEKIDIEELDIEKLESNIEKEIRQEAEKNKILEENKEKFLNKIFE